MGTIAIESVSCAQVEFGQRSYFDTGAEIISSLEHIFHHLFGIVFGHPGAGIPQSHTVVPGSFVIDGD